MNQLRQTKIILYDFIQVLSENRKINVRYVLILLPVAICMGAVCFINTGIDSRLPAKALQLLLFASAGIIHLYFLKRKISILWFRFLGDGILYTSCAAVLIFISLVIFYLIAAGGTVLMALASSAVFTLPHILLHAWSAYIDIPEKEFEVWTRPLPVDDESVVLFTSNSTVHLKITRRYFDVVDETFTRTMPEQKRLGEIFFSVLEEENRKKKNSIESLDKLNEAFAWEFYTAPFLKIGKPRRLDPEGSLADNGLPGNAVVFVKRVQQISANRLQAVFSQN